MVTHISGKVGLDPPTLTILSPLLHRLALANAPRLVLALRPQDALPEWITHLVYLDKECNVVFQGPKEKMLTGLKGKLGSVGELPGAGIPQEQEHVHTSKGEGQLASSSDSPDDVQDEDSVGEELSLGGISESKVNKGVFNWRSLGIVERSLARQQQRALERSDREILVNMEGVRVEYGDKTVLGNWTQRLDDQQTRGLWWDVRRGDRWGIFGPNG